VRDELLDVQHRVVPVPRYSTLSLVMPAAAEKGEVCATGGFCFSDFGFRISRFPFCWPFAMRNLL
jgi:hypothetical protein